MDFEWGARMHADPNIANYNDKTIFATVYENEDKGMQAAALLDACWYLNGIRGLSCLLGVPAAPHGEWDEKIDFVRSDDFFASHHDTYVKCGNAFEIIAGKVVASTQ